MMCSVGVVVGHGVFPNVAEVLLVRSKQRCSVVCHVKDLRPA